ncbi:MULTISPECIES: hypothetical protein [Nostocales]|uniref:Uncharacterized protein n=3 Tax=Nostocales TaxID=1161 RepID=A0A0C1RJY3_9CYAN|nr:hypothetical protein [Tolypothrix bouteillei]KAF3890348.1 hypothetical protein DA73_0400036545 [Tolypothrix bouteillei VB521301]
MKPSVYFHAVLVASSLGMLLLPLGCQKLGVSFERTGLGSSSTSTERAFDLQSTVPISTSSSSVPNSTTNISKEVSPTNITTDTGNSRASGFGSLRMSNQTNQPVRLALLSRNSLIKGKGNSAKTAHDAVPAHWDFAPQEGSEKGLILALPNGDLKLEKGDILVAFAQDGSRRYWGPYVVGETFSPSWNAQSKEWQLVLMNTEITDNQ